MHQAADPLTLRAVAFFVWKCFCRLWENFSSPLTSLFRIVKVTGDVLCLTVTICYRCSCCESAYINKDISYLFESLRGAACYLLWFSLVDFAPGFTILTKAKGGQIKWRINPNRLSWGVWIKDLINNKRLKTHVPSLIFVAKLGSGLW